MSNLDLKRFVLRSEVLKLYRTFLRISKGAPSIEIRSMSSSILITRTNIPLSFPTSYRSIHSLLCHPPFSNPKHPPFLSDEIRGQVRQEFETQKHLNEAYSIKYALSDGRAKLKQLEAMFGMTS